MSTQSPAIVAPQGTPSKPIPFSAYRLRGGTLTKIEKEGYSRTEPIKRKHVSRRAGTGFIAAGRLGPREEASEASRGFIAKSILFVYSRIKQSLPTDLTASPRRQYINADRKTVGENLHGVGGLC